MTAYCAEIRYHATGHTCIVRYETLTARVLALLAIEEYVRVIREWEEHHNSPIMTEGLHHASVV